MTLPKYKILVTGAGGFIGFHVSMRLLHDGHEVVGLDNMNDYYDVGLKRSRQAILLKQPHFRFVEQSLEKKSGLDELFRQERFDVVVNLAAQAGVRYSLTNPYAYLDSNLAGFLTILEACRNFPVRHLIYASSSSVYGANSSMPFSTHDNVDHPLALYAASKKSNELMAHAYANLFSVPSTGLRFFTVYGPYGRPDMAVFIFTKAILAGQPIDVYNYGNMKRDFTYIDDIVDGLVRLIPHPPVANPAWDRRKPDPATSFAPYQLFNIGNNKPVQLLHVIETLEAKLGKKATKNFLPLQDGDVVETFANIDDLTRVTGFTPSTPIETGIERFVDWYLNYYRN
ncbi:MAG TPA: NAD-dependent epimerase [Cyclobacteriaceae bacterium]|nr:NAD-dependent epimerase [Cyclobacteriaceae bacterium]